MRTNILLAILSISILASITGYLVISSNKEQLALETSVYDQCRVIRTDQRGAQYPSYYYYVGNDCEQPMKFTYKYKLDQSDTIEIFETKCLNQLAHQLLNLPKQCQVIEIIESRC